MSEYFTQIPRVQYPNLEDPTYVDSVVLTNIMTRSAFLREIMENTALFYDYQIKDGETPEIIADKLYGNVDKFWIVLLFNNLHNPYYDFPLTQDQLNTMILNKYGYSVETALTTIHHYEQRTTKSVYYNNILQSEQTEILTISDKAQDANTGLAIDRPILPSVADTSLAGATDTQSFGSGVTVTTSDSYWAISVWTYENDENEKRRSITLLDKNYIIPVENELRRLMRDGN